MAADANRIPLTVIHYSRHDPRRVTGGVERFGLTLERVFERVEFLTPDCRRERREALSRQIPIICDNQRVMDWPEGHPVIGFQHGVGAVKFQATRSLLALESGASAEARRRAAADAMGGGRAVDRVGVRIAIRDASRARHLLSNRLRSIRRPARKHGIEARPSRRANAPQGTRAHPCAPVRPAGLVVRTAGVPSRGCPRAHAKGEGLHPSEPL